MLDGMWATSNAAGGDGSAAENAQVSSSGPLVAVGPSSPAVEPRGPGRAPGTDDGRMCGASGRKT